jgi:DNA-dependent protein kinase catalytic subunit
LEFQEYRERFLEQILPSLDSYLQTQDTIGVIKTNAKVAKFQRRRGVKTSKSPFVAMSNESELYKFQKRVLLFLGTLEPNICVKMLKESNEEDRYNLVKWDLNECIRLQLLCTSGIRPTILLDSIVSRICALALKSSDRRTKISGCELLHAIILYTIGTNNHNSRKKIWRELCEHTLLLSVDADVAVQQMFEPLLIQTIHYLTQQSQITDKAAEILVDCLLNSISHKTNTNVRDLAARCVREFLTWAIKQTPNHRDSPANIEIILVKLKIMCQDSDPNRRMGAVLGFNNIYTILREEEAIIEKRWFDLFYSFCMNFTISEEFDNAAVNLDQISAAIDHFVRVLERRKDLFNVEYGGRIVPKGFEVSYRKY